jgi:hypothetical protein
LRAAAPDGGPVWVESKTVGVRPAARSLTANLTAKRMDRDGLLNRATGRESQRNRTLGLRWTPADGACGDS